MRFLPIGVSALLLAASFAFGLSPDDILKNLSHEQVEAQLPAAQPEYVYIYAGRRRKEGEDQAALMWSYVGQLRYRIYRDAHPGSDSSLYNALNTEIGTPLNHYGAKHLDQWLKAIDAALAWDDQHDNAVTPKTQFAEIYARERKGLEGLKATIVSRQAEFKAAALGQEPAPKDWGALAPIASIKDLEGTFTRSEPGGIWGSLIPSAGHPILATEFEIKALSANRILTIARNMWGETGRGELEVVLIAGAAKFDLPDTVGRYPRGGGMKGTAYLRKTTSGDLMLERDVEVEADHPVGHPAELEPHRLWQHAASGHSLTREEFENRLPATPQSYFTYAQNVLAHGLNEEAVKWFYLGKLRTSIYLKTHPTGETAARNAARMAQGLAGRLEPFCRERPDAWRRAIAAAISWDDQHSQNIGLSPAQLAEAEAEPRAFLLKTRQAIDSHPASEPGWQTEFLLH